MFEYATCDIRVIFRQTDPSVRDFDTSPSTMTRV